MRVNPVPDRSGPEAFTLPELLVVLAVVAVLAAFAVPAVSGALEKGHRAACLNNLKQLTAAFQIYVSEKGSLPANTSSGAGPTGAMSNPGSWVVGNAQATASLANLTNGALYPYVRDVKVYRCPADKSTIAGGSTKRTRSYSMNGFLSGNQTQTWAPVPRLAGVPKPAQTFVFLDENDASIDDGLFQIDRGPGTSWGSIPSDRHSQGCNISFADGRVE